MPANPFNGFTEYGLGIGLRVPHYRHILFKKPVVAWFEITSENFMVDGGRPLELLDSILEQYRVVQHGVAIYFGSAEKLNREHLKRLRHLASRTREQTLIGLRRSKSGLITGPALDGFAPAHEYLISSHPPSLRAACYRR